MAESSRKLNEEGISPDNVLLFSFKRLLSKKIVVIKLVGVGNCSLFTTVFFETLHVI
jgi:hypothetical protein